MCKMNVLLSQLNEVNKALVTASAGEALMLLERQTDLQKQIADLECGHIRTAA